MTGKEFTKRIDFCLAKKNQTRKAITTDLGISSSTMSSWAAGRGSIPNANIVEKIAKYLNVTIDWLITGEENSDFTFEERELITKWRELTEEAKKKIRFDIEYYLSENIKKNQEHA